MDKNKYFITLLIIASMFIVNGCDDTREVKMIKEGKLESCPNATVNQMVDGFIGSPSWESNETAEGQKFVNITGRITYSEKEVDALIQFFIDPDKGTFNFNAFEINELPQNNLLAMGLLEKMCESTKN
jgi:hypothetical protein